jgi:hypothetical protein
LLVRRNYNDVLLIVWWVLGINEDLLIWLRLRLRNRFLLINWRIYRIVYNLLRLRLGYGLYLISLRLRDKDLLIRHNWIHLRMWLIWDINWPRLWLYLILLIIINKVYGPIDSIWLVLIPRNHIIWVNIECLIILIESLGFIIKL